MAPSMSLPFCWLPGETLQEREDEDGMPYRVWAEQGHLLTFPGRTTDPKRGRAENRRAPWPL